MEDRAALWHGACAGDHEHSSAISLYGVLDGHGSDVVSQRLSEELPGAVMREVCEAESQSSHGLLGVNYTAAFQAAFHQLDQQLIRQQHRQQEQHRQLQQQQQQQQDSMLDRGLSSDPLDLQPLPPPDWSSIGSAEDPGSTAVVALLLRRARAVVVANVGNSRALLCSSKDASGSGHEHGPLRPVPLSRPHELWQSDERERVLAAGGTVTGGTGGRVARLESDLELSRAFGDLRYRGKGLIATPEVQGPTLLDKGDQFLILASDGLFEVLSETELCAHAHAVAAGRAHPALSAPRPPAIPMHAAGPSPRASLSALSLLGLKLAEAAGTLWTVLVRAVAAVRDGHRGSLGGSVTDALPPAPLVFCCDCLPAPGQQAEDACDELAPDSARQPADTSSAAARRQRRRRKGSSMRAASREDGIPPTLSELVSWRLVQEAYNRGSMDNLAVVVVDLTALQVDHALGAPSDSALGNMAPLALRGRWPEQVGTGLLALPMLTSTCRRQPDGGSSGDTLMGEPSASRSPGRDDVCAWTLREGDQERQQAESEEGELLSGLGGMNGKQLPSAPSLAYVLTRRIATVPSASAWHCNAYGEDSSCGASEPLTGGVTRPLELEALADAWASDTLALDLLLSPEDHLGGGTATVTAPLASKAAALPAQQLAASSTSSATAPAVALAPAGALARVESAREALSDVVNLLASVCLPEHASDVCWSVQSEAAALAGSVTAPGLRMPAGSEVQPPLPNVSGTGEGGLPVGLLLAGPVISPAGPAAAAGALEPQGGRRGRALLLWDLLEPEAPDIEAGASGADYGGVTDEHQRSDGLASEPGVASAGAATAAELRGDPHRPSAAGMGSIMSAHGGASERHRQQRTFLGEGSAVYHLSKRRGQGHFGEVWQAVQYVSGGMGGAEHGAGNGGAPPCPDNLAPCGPAGGSGGPDDGGTSHHERQETPPGEGDDAHGPPWVAHGQFVLKRLLTERGGSVKLSGLREAYFGELLHRHQASAEAGVVEPGAATGGASPGGVEGLQHLVRFVESFQATSSSQPAPDTGGPPGAGPSHADGSESEGGQAQDLWLVFHDEGTSLHDYMYEAVTPEGAGSGEPSGDPASGAEAGREEPQAGSAFGGGGGGDARGEQGGEEEERGGGGGFQILGPSRWWKELRQGPGGGAAVRSLLRQLLLALDALHSLNITHRDVKPENMLLRPVAAAAGGSAAGEQQRPCEEPAAAAAGGRLPAPARPADPPDRRGGSRSRADSGRQAGGGAGRRGPAGSAGKKCGGAPAFAPDYHMRLIDLGSAIDKYSLQHLYGTEGPSAAQLTLEYAPPEALFGRYWEGSHSLKPNVWAHDVWAAGVVWLELLLGTPHVFQLPPHTRAMIDVKLRMSERSEGDRQLLYLLRGMMEWCTYPPQVPNKLRGRKELVSWSCTEQAIMRLIKARDPTGVGIESVAGVRLLQRLLHWEPSLRPTPRQALNHAFFQQPAAAGSRGGETTNSAAQCASFPDKGWC